MGPVSLPGSDDNEGNTYNGQVRVGGGGDRRVINSTCFCVLLCQRSVHACPSVHVNLAKHEMHIR